MRKLSEYFGTSLDYWVSESAYEQLEFTQERNERVGQYRVLNEKDKGIVKEIIHSFYEKTESYQA